MDNYEEDEKLEERLTEISDQMRQFVMDIPLMSLKKSWNKNQVFNEFTAARMSVAPSNDPF